jgi:hypothetical protein
MFSYVCFAILHARMQNTGEHLPRKTNMEPTQTTTTEQQAANGQPRPAPRKHVESPQAFYERFTKREDVRWLLKKLAGR